MWRLLSVLAKPSSCHRGWLETHLVLVCDCGRAAGPGGFSAWGWLLFLDCYKGVIHVVLRMVEGVGSYWCLRVRCVPACVLRPGGRLWEEVEGAPRLAGCVRRHGRRPVWSNIGRGLACVPSRHVACVGKGLCHTGNMEVCFGCGCASTLSVCGDARITQATGFFWLPHLQARFLFAGMPV